MIAIPTPGNGPCFPGKLSDVTIKHFKEHEVHVKGFNSIPHE